MKKITPFLCLLLICAMVLPVIPATAAETKSYLYNGVELPDIYTVWPNKENYPNACIFKSTGSGNIWLYFGSLSTVSTDTFYFSYHKAYKLVDGAWVSQSSGYAVGFCIEDMVDKTPIWTNFDVVLSDGSLIISATDPVPVGGDNSIYLYDYASGTQLTEYTVTPPCIITATSTGIQIADSSTGDVLHSYIWTEADYFAGFSVGSQDYVEYGIGQSFECSSSEEPISLYLYSNKYPVLDGIWKANDYITGSTAISHDLNFAIGDVSYTGMNYQFSGSLKTLSYQLSSGKETVYVDQWYGDSKKTIDLGPASQLVSPEFYTWFTSNFTRTGDSAAADDVGQVRIYDYASGRLLQTLSLPTPNIVFATVTGIQIQEYSSAETLFSYTWSGTGDFAGFSTLSRDWVEYEIGSNFVNLSGDLTLYLYGDGDTEDSTDPEDPDATDPTEPEATDPTDPDDSGSTEPTEDVLDKEKDEAENQGNDSIDQILDVIPNVKDDIVAAYDDLIRALKYEGTTAKLMTPAIVIPEMPGSVPKIVLLEPQVIDFEYWFNLMPSGIMLVVRALFTGALILYCGYEVYGLIEYFVSLRGHSRKSGG